VDRPDLLVRLGRQKHEADGDPARPDAAKEGQWPGLIEGEPNRGTGAIQQLILGKLVQGTTQPFSIPSQRRQCGDVTLRTLVTPGSEFLPLSAKTGEGIPRAIVNSRPSVGFGQSGRSSPGRSRTAVADCLSGRAWRPPIRELPAGPSSTNRDCTKARPPYRHMPRMRAPTSTRTPSVAGHTADPGVAIGHAVRSKRPSSPSGMKRVREA
jgi:hypothetical protein